MSLEPGTRLGPYEIDAEIGAGGMGEVYRANDTRLGRTVAIKVLSGHLSERPDVRQRFEREARTISNLSHPHICALYDIGRDDGTDYLVMEYLEGESLADRLARGRLTPTEVLPIASQITQALDKAHRGGIVHRDLKPGNIMLTKSGVKLLDFGLAKIADQASPVASAVTEMATQHDPDKPLTAEGTILGTFQYMAPEQLEGEDADSRSDIFSLGAVLYEMATGQKAFEGRNQASLIAAILKEHPKPISQIEPMTPLALDRLTRACLEKDPEDRIQTAHDINLQLTWIGEGGSDVGLPLSPVRKRRRRERTWAITSLVLFAAAVALGALAFLQPADTSQELVALSLTRPHDAVYEVSENPALSPDGRYIAFVGIASDDRRSLWIRPLSDGSATELPATDGAEHPFWSPDSRHIGFFAGGKLQKTDPLGGPPQVICDADNPEGATWGSAGVIVFSSRARGQRGRRDANVIQALRSVPETGGKPTIITELEPYEQAHIWPSFLPDGRHFVFLGDAPTAEGHHLRLGSLDSKEAKNVINAISNFQFVPPSTVLFCRSGTLIAQELDTDRGELVGEPVPLASELVDRDGHYYEFTASHNGTLAYRSASPLRQLTWYERSGKSAGTVGERIRLGYPVNLSPDENQVAIQVLDSDGRDSDVWILDLARNMTSRLTQDSDNGTHAWSPDGTQIAFNSSRLPARGWHFYTKSTTGPGEAILVSDSLTGELYDWSDDGRYLLAFIEETEPTDLWAIPTNGEAPIPLASVELNPWGGRFSPNGRWVAYAVESNGQNEIYVQSFPGLTRRTQVARGGWGPRWRADGRELFYASADDDAVMSVDIGEGGSFTVGTPRILFEVSEGFEDFDVTSDGKRFIVVANVVDRYSEPLTVVLNWRERLKKGGR